MRMTSLGLTLALLIGVAHAAMAQAFVPAKGDVSVSVLYQNGLVKKHMLSTAWVDAGRINSKNLSMDFSVGLGHKWAFGASLPYTSSKYNGTKPHLLGPGEATLLPAFRPVDDGLYHGTVQDLRFDLRYNLTTRGVVLTPIVTFIIPSHDYQALGHAAFGHGYRETQFGVYAARVFRPWRFLPTGFVQARYAIGFEEKILDVSRQRHLMSAEGGYFLTPRLRMFGMAMKQITHGGIDIIISPRADFPAPSPYFVHHDQISRENMLNLGGGAAFSVSNKIDIFGSAIRTVSGINGHAISRLITVGATYSFSLGRQKQPAPGADDADCHVNENDPANALAKCLCLKKE